MKHPVPYKIKPFTRRPVRFLGLWQEQGWRLKFYGISQHGDNPGNALVEKAGEITRLLMPQPAISACRYGLSFVTIHQADPFNQIIVD